MNCSGTLIRFSSLLIVFITVFAATIHADEIFALNRKANQLYDQGRYDEALELYKEALLLDPSEKKLRMNKGSALYNLGDYDGAKEFYSEALTAEDRATLADAHYNLGNILFRNGQQLQAAGNPEARKMYQQSLDNYINALDIRPDDKDAKWNLQLTNKQIEEVEQQQQNQQQRGDDSDDQGDDQQQQQQPQQGENDQQDQNDHQQDQPQQDEHQTPEEQDMDAGPMQQDNSSIEEDEAAQLIEMFADDADDLHKPPQQQRPDNRRPQKDW